MKRTKEQCLQWLEDRKDVLNIAGIEKRTGISYLTDAVNKKVNKRVGDKEYRTNLASRHVSTLNEEINRICGK